MKYRDLKWPAGHGLNLSTLYVPALLGKLEKKEAGIDVVSYLLTFPFPFEETNTRSGRSSKHGTPPVPGTCPWATWRTTTTGPWPTARRRAGGGPLPGKAGKARIARRTEARRKHAKKT